MLTSPLSKKTPSPVIIDPIPEKLKTDLPDLLIIACAGYNNEVLKILKDMNLKINLIFLLEGLDLIKV